MEIDKRLRAKLEGLIRSARHDKLACLGASVAFIGLIASDHDCRYAGVCSKTGLYWLRAIGYICCFGFSLRLHLLEILDCRLILLQMPSTKDLESPRFLVWLSGASQSAITKQARG